MLIFSDLHLRDESAELVLGTILPAIRQEALDRGEMVIACLGDALHFRYRVPAPLLNGFCDWCLQVVADGTELIFLPGNHDQYELGGRNALEPLASIPGVTVHTEPTLDAHGLWIPYRKDPEDILAVLQQHGGGARTAYMHHDVKGAWMNDNMRNREGLPPEAFQAFVTVICGHYHRYHSVGNATYVGSPYQTKADESGQDKGFATWTSREIASPPELRFHPQKWGKRYHRIRLEKDEVPDFSGVCPGDDVRVTTAVGVDPTVIGRNLKAMGVETHAVTPDVVAAEQRLDVDEDATLNHYAEAYVHQVGGDLSTTRLMEVYEEVIRG